MVAGRQEAKKEEVRKDCLKRRQDRIGKDSEYDGGDGDECAVVAGKGSRRD